MSMSPVGIAGLYAKSSHDSNSTWVAVLLCRLHRRFLALILSIFGRFTTIGIAEGCCRVRVHPANPLT